MKESQSDNPNCAACVNRINPNLPVTGVEDGTKVSTDEEENGSSRKKELLLIAASALLFICGLIFGDRLHNTPLFFGEYLVYLTAYLISGWRVLIRAGRNILHGKFFDENFLMAAATIGAIVIHELPEAVGVMLFFQIGEFLQELSVNHSRKSIRALLDIRPGTAHLKTEDGIKDARPEEIKVGDSILIKPGEKVPLDGTIITGSSQVDTSPITGEPVPRSVHENDAVLAGMINQTGILFIRVTKLFEESSISKILYLVEESVKKKAKTERFITKFAHYYTPLVVFGALSVAVFPPLFLENAAFSEWIYRALVLLVISCPCALLISIPLGFFGGIGKASRRGILIKGSNYLDALTSAKTVVFDKTGTLTKGVFKVTGIVPKTGFTADELLQTAAEAEAHSGHPIAKSILEAYGRKIDISHIQDYKEIGGFGINAIVRNRKVIAGNDRLLHRNNIPHDLCKIDGTVIHVAVDNRYAGYIVISDEIKDDALRAVQKLRKAGVRQIGMLTGDNQYEADIISRKLGLDFAYADLLPEGKVDALESIMAKEGEKAGTVFVGDGINDSPVIARADIGIAMGNLGSDAAIETADIVLMTDSPSKVAEAIEIAKKTRKIVWENILIAFLVKGVFVALGIAGTATMWQAVFADMGVALLAIFNALRVLR